MVRRPLDGPDAGRRWTCRAASWLLMGFAVVAGCGAFQWIFGTIFCWAGPRFFIIAAFAVLAAAYAFGVALSLLSGESIWLIAAWFPAGFMYVPLTVFTHAAFILAAAYVMAIVLYAAGLAGAVSGMRLKRRSKCKAA